MHEAAGQTWTHRTMAHRPCSWRGRGAEHGALRRVVRQVQRFGPPHARVRQDRPLHAPRAERRQRGVRVSDRAQLGLRAKGITFIGGGFCGNAVRGHMPGLTGRREMVGVQQKTRASSPLSGCIGTAWNSERCRSHPDKGDGRSSLQVWALQISNVYVPDH